MMNAASVAAVAIGSQVMQTITGIILGLTTGTTVLIAIATGARDDRQVASTIGSSIWLFALLGISLTLDYDSESWSDSFANAYTRGSDA